MTGIRDLPQPVRGAMRIAGDARRGMLDSVHARPDSLRVLIAGGSFAAAEAALALHAYAGERVAVELVAPEGTFGFRPAAAAAVFAGGEVATFDLAELARDTGATLTCDRLEAVAPAVKRVRLASGAQRDYDALVLAVGARARAGIPGALTFRDQRDAGRLARVVREVRAGEVRSVALAVPPGIAWSVPVYEIAFFLAAEVERLGLDTEVTVVTPERRALEVFGGEVSTEVAGLLADHDVRVVFGAAPRVAERGSLRLDDGATVAAERVIAVPALTGRRVPGVPADFGGFVRTGALGHVEGLADVYAAGDMTSFPVKQGGLAAQQAATAAAVIALGAGASPHTTRREPVLRTQLFGIREPLYLEAALDPLGRPLPGRSHVSSRPPWPSASTLVGPHVTAWMAEQHALAA
jgi:sulfide:quinone oxidoreductase